MAKLQHNFVRGRMNKDLDERLVPNGEYRDAQNIQVSTSEDSDVGAIENILGNTKKNLLSTGPDVFWDSIFGLASATCIGAVRDTENEKLYWFITGETPAPVTVDAILEFDQSTGIVAPVLVDVNGVLNFSENYLITGVNVLDGMLYWTDNLNEPRALNIDRFKTGSVQPGTKLQQHTHVYGAARDFIDTDITVIKESPREALTVTAFDSIYGGPGTGINPIEDAVFVTHPSGLEPGDTSVLNWTPSITWTGLVNPTVLITAQFEEETGIVNKYQVIGTLSGIAATTATLTVDSLTSNIPTSITDFEMILVEDEPIFKNDFPRFSYRYKYPDGEYSTYAPFTKAAFVPGQFEYTGRDGFNQGMEDVIRKITLSNFPTTPVNVDQVEVVYKNASSNNIYLIETFNYDFSSGTVPVLNVDITSDSLGRVIESNQLLRLYDAVPIKAQAQEIIGNRVVYGNYVHNYDVINGDIVMQVAQTNTTHTDPGFGKESIKTDRKYQIGISFLDEYGRESPVFTSVQGSISLQKENCDKENTIQANITSGSVIPAWAEKFKLYVKNNTPEYYNLALDRYYDAEDGNVWLSFPSSERNKVQEGQFITLKKVHDGDTPVKINNRYKINAISNEAPSFIKQVNEVVGNVLSFAWMPVGDEGFEVGNNSIKFWSEIRDQNPPYYDGFIKGAKLYFQTENLIGKSSEYTVYSGGPIGSSTLVPIIVNSREYIPYEIILEEAIRTEDQWLANLPDQHAFVVTLENIKEVNSPEFVGRFFAKISPNGTFFDSIPNEFNPDILQYIEDKRLVPSTSGLFTLLGQNDAIARLTWKDEYQPPAYPSTSTYPPTSGTTTGGLKNGQNNFNIYYQNGPNDSFLESFWSSLIATGTKIKFTDVAGAIISNEFYSIIKVEDTSGTYGAVDTYTRFDGAGVPVGNTARWVKITLDRAWNDLAGIYPAGIVIYREQIRPVTAILSSPNPAVFETEPEEFADLDLYYEASDAIDVYPPTYPVDPPNVKVPQTLEWFNCYSFGNGVESDRIRDDFNAPTLGKGVRVSSIIEEPYRQERRKAGLIFSGIYNSITGINNTNQFLTGEDITKDLNPIHGSIQKLHARDTDLVTLCEDKSFRILANKDALFNADGNTNVTSNTNVLGQAVPFSGEFGISKNPESFVSYGFRSYYADKARGAVIRLSRDGITEISEKGMSDFFQDDFKTQARPILGMYDENSSSYNISVGNELVSFKEDVDGWSTRLTYQPEFGLSLNQDLYTFHNGELWKHTNETRSNFYGVQYDSTVTPIINDAPASVKNFKTLSYEGDDGWTAEVTTNKQEGRVNTWVEREGIYFNYISGIKSTWTNGPATPSNPLGGTGTLDFREFSTQGVGNIVSVAPAIAPGPYDLTMGQTINVSAQVNDRLFVKRGSGVVDEIGKVISIDRPNKSIRVSDLFGAGNEPQGGDYVFVVKDEEKNTSGILGYYAETKLTTTSGSKKELFALNSEVFISSE